MSEHDSQEISRRKAIRRLGLGVAGLPLLGGVGLGGVGLGGLANTNLADLIQGKKKAKNAEGRKTVLGVGYRPLGKTGINVSEITVGCGGINANNSRIVEAALDQGINFLDTASGYQRGRSELAIGEILKARKGKRDKIVIATKATGINHGQLTRFTDERVERILREKLEKSLKALQTDYVDVYFVQHGSMNPKIVDYPQMWKAIEKFKKEGKIKAVALSTHTNYRATGEAVIASGHYDILMTIINAPTMDPEVAKMAAKGGDEEDQGGRRRRRRRRRKTAVEDMRKVTAACRKNGIGLMAMKAAKDGYFPGQTWTAGVEAYSSKDERETYSDHQILYRKVLGDDIATVNIGMSRMSYLDEALALAEALDKAKKGKNPKKKSARKRVRKG